MKIAIALKSQKLWKTLVGTKKAVCTVTKPVLLQANAALEILVRELLVQETGASWLVAAIVYAQKQQELLAAFPLTLYSSNAYLSFRR